ncbi:hypothetical protein [Halorubellus litoreus]|uniref:FAR-17a/AIG1-like protein n=1 Tax=Halorubellus litoreus TaxID=755308 RepID=A0ABD5VBF2_9EURY
MAPIRAKDLFVTFTIFELTLLLYYGLIAIDPDLVVLRFWARPLHWTVVSTYALTALGVAATWLHYERPLEVRDALAIAGVVCLVQVPLSPMITHPFYWRPLSETALMQGIYSQLRLGLPIALLLPLGAAGTKREFAAVLALACSLPLLAVLYRAHNHLYYGGYQWPVDVLALNATVGFAVAIGLGTLNFAIGRYAATRTPS